MRSVVRRTRKAGLRVIDNRERSIGTQVRVGLPVPNHGRRMNIISFQFNATIYFVPKRPLECQGFPRFLWTGPSRGETTKNQLTLALANNDVQSALDICEKALEKGTCPPSMLKLLFKPSQMSHSANILPK